MLRLPPESAIQTLLPVQRIASPRALEVLVVVERIRPVFGITYRFSGFPDVEGRNLAFALKRNEQPHGRIPQYSR